MGKAERFDFIHQDDDMHVVSCGFTVYTVHD